MRVLTQEIVDFNWPKHNRKGCSDENTYNAFYDESIERSHPECYRCLAIELIGQFVIL